MIRRLLYGLMGKSQGEKKKENPHEVREKRRAPVQKRCTGADGGRIHSRSPEDVAIPVSGCGSTGIVDLLYTIYFMFCQYLVVYFFSQVDNWFAWLGLAAGNEQYREGAVVEKLNILPGM